MTRIEALRDRTVAVGVVGLGYVGVPLVAALQRHFSVYGFDSDERRVRALQSGIDRRRSVGPEDLVSMRESCSSDPTVLGQCGFIIIAVPTPVTATRVPDLEPLEGAARTVGRHLTPGTVVVLESTVYPGVTEEVVGPTLSRESDLEAGAGFFLGYSPERVNPGDNTHSLPRIPKVIAGASSAVTELMAAVYGTITSGVHRAASIKTAEAAKLLENTQRDLNIALMNEAAMIFDRLGVDTQEVIRTASTKWNFARFQPGLVGGPCIGTDSYYLTHAAQKIGHQAHLILAGRQVNDAMGRYVAERTGALIQSHPDQIEQARVLILGFTFKEDFADIRNTRVAEIIDGLEEQGMRCSVFDPEADADDVHEHYGVTLLDDVTRDAPYDAIVVAVRHRKFRSMFPAEKLLALMARERPILIDVKSMYDRRKLEEAGFTYSRL